MTSALLPDDRDWTWVLDRPCPECQFQAGEFDAETTGDALRCNAAAWGELLTREKGALTVRRRPDRWSDLEYAVHVRDVCRLYLERLDLMLAEDDPLFPDWDQDVTAVEDDYNAQDPAVVSAQLLSAAAGLAEAFDSVANGQWRRRGRRSDGASFTVDSFARYLVHDPVHHLWDVTGTTAEEQ